MNKQVAIVLGGTYPHKALLINLRRRGYYTILIDYYEFPPAKVNADEHIQESTLDKETVLKIAKDRKASLVIATCIDQANLTACYVAEKLKLPAPYSYEVALLVTNKKFMKELMSSNGIPTSKYISVTNKDDYKIDNLKFPLIIKPTDSNSSKGVRRASNSAELEAYLKEALEISRKGGAIIEEFIEGKEISIDCFIKDKKVTILSTKEKRKLPNDKNNPIQQIQNAHYPAGLKDKCMAEIKNIGNRIAEVFNLDNTPLLIQAMVKNDNVSVIEFAPRIGGGENYRVTELYAGFDIINAAVNSFLGLPVDLNLSYSTYHYSTVFLYAKSNVFGHVKGYEELIEDKTIEYFHLFKVPGMQIGIDLSSNNRIGTFMVKSKTLEELEEKIKKSIEVFEIYDINNIPVMRRDIYSN